MNVANTTDPSKWSNSTAKHSLLALYILSDRKSRHFSDRPPECIQSGTGEVQIFQTIADLENLLTSVSNRFLQIKSFSAERYFKQLNNKEDLRCTTLLLPKYFHLRQKELEVFLNVHHRFDSVNNFVYLNQFYDYSDDAELPRVSFATLFSWPYFKPWGWLHISHILSRHNSKHCCWENVLWHIRKRVFCSCCVL